MDHPAVAALGAVLLAACLSSCTAGKEDDGKQDGDGTPCRACGGDGDGDGDGSVGDGDVGDGDGDGDGDAGSDPNYVMPGQICQRLSAIQCAGEADCCDSVTRSESQCNTTMYEGCMTELFLDEAAMRPITGFDADRAFTAFTEFERLADACDPEIAGIGLSADGLAGMMQGTLDPGENCNKGVATDVDALASMLSCKTPATHACLPAVALWSCAPRGQVGANCFWDANCVDGLFCDNPQFDRLDTLCEARRGDGEACSTPNTCKSLTCRGDVCVTATKQTAYCLEQ